MPTFLVPGRGATGRRPQGPPVLNAASPFVRGLTARWVYSNAATPYSLIRSIPGVQEGGTTTLRGELVTSLMGVAGASAYINTRQTVTTAAQAFSGAAWVRFPSLAARCGIFGQRDGGGDGVAFEYGSTANALSFILFGAFGQRDSSSTSGLITAGVPVLVGFSYGGTFCSFYVNGRLVSTSTFGAYSIIQVSSSYPCYLQAWNNQSGGGGGAIGAGATDLAEVSAWNRVLSDADHWSLYDPQTRWDLYYVPGRRVFFDLAAGGGSFKSAWAARANTVIRAGRLTA